MRSFDHVISDIPGVEPEADHDDDAPELVIGPAQFNLARHDCTVTLTSPSGDHRTFKIATKQKGKLAGKRVVSLLIGPNNAADYEGFAFVVDGRVKVWHRLTALEGEPPTQYERFADLFTDPVYWSGRGVKYMFSLKCRRCGHPLTHPDSIMTGLGPICAGRE
jgi:hypothetical protein